MSESGKAQEKAYPLAGKVTIDGQTPKFTDRSYRLVVVLNDPDNLGVPATQRPHVEAKKNGEFAFSRLGNGTESAGKYIVTFGAFERRAKFGFIPPDKLHNLYGDPDANAKLPSLSLITRPRGTMTTTSIWRSPAKDRWSLARTGFNGLMDENVPGADRYRRKK